MKTIRRIIENDQAFDWFIKGFSIMVITILVVAYVYLRWFS